MSHNLAQDLFGAKLVVAREKAWHNLGIVFQDKPSLIEAFERARLNYKLEIIQSQFMWEGKSYNAAGEFHVVRAPIVDPLGNMDSEIPLSLGGVSKDYHILQNEDLATWFNPLSEIYPVESAGALGSGEKVFFTLDAGMVEINGEEIHQFFIVRDDKTGTEKTKILYSPVRVVCQNTLFAAERDATFTMNVRHSRGNDLILQKISSATEGMKRMVDHTNNIFGEFGKAKFSLEDFKEMIKYLYPEPTRKENVMEVGINVTQEIEKIKEMQNACVEIYSQYNDENPSMGNTKWNAYNVIPDFEQFHRVGRGEGQYNQMLFGTRSNIVRNAFSYLNK